MYPVIVCVLPGVTPAAGSTASVTEGDRKSHFSSRGLAINAATIVPIRPMSATIIIGSSRRFVFLFERLLISDLRDLVGEREYFPRTYRDSIRIILWNKNPATVEECGGMVCYYDFNCISN